MLPLILNLERACKVASGTSVLELLLYLAVCVSGGLWQLLISIRTVFSLPIYISGDNVQMAMPQNNREGESSCH